MTKKSNKIVHKEIADRLEQPLTPANRKAHEDIIFGDENNPSEKFHVGEDIIDVLRDEKEGK